MPETEVKQAETESEPEQTDAEKNKKKKTKKSKQPTSDEDEKPKRARGNRETPVYEMVLEALEVLRDRKGVPLPTIKRYLEENFKMDTQKSSRFIKKAILNGVESGQILRLRGAGAAGRFNVKHTRSPIKKKRKAPEEYMELPPPTKKRKTTTTSSAASKAKTKEDKEEKMAAKGKPTAAKATPKGKAKGGRFGRKK